jgi:hypothetical protein
MDTEEEKWIGLRVRNVWKLRLGRLLALLICLPLGLFLIFSGAGIGSGVLLLLCGVWLLMDNPLELLAILEGSCPSCGRRVEGHRGSLFRCPTCLTVIGLQGGRLQLLKNGVSIPDPEFDEPRGPTQTALPDEPLKVILGDTLDLHTFLPEDVPSLLNEFLAVCQRDGIRRARIIHGKGTSVLRRRVRSLLSRDPRVVACYDAPPESGGWGATIVELI